MIIWKLLRNSVSVILRARAVRIMCPVEEMGRNSVMPSTRPKMTAWSAVNMVNSVYPHTYYFERSAFCSFEASEW